MPIFLLAVALLLAGCADTQKAATYRDKIAEACAVAEPLAPLGGPAAPYIIGGCIGAEAISRLAADPSSLEWVHGLIGMARASA